MLCKSCLVDREVIEFYSSNKTTCKECVKSRSRQRLIDNPEAVKAYEKSRAKEPHRVKARLDYSKTDTGRKAGDRAKKRYIETNPKKRSVHIKVGNAIRDGYLVKQACEVCKTNYNIVAHHCDYDKPFDVMRLCAQHHSDWHSINGEALNSK